MSNSTTLVDVKKKTNLSLLIPNEERGQLNELLKQYGAMAFHIGAYHATAVKEAANKAGTLKSNK